MNNQEYNTEIESIADEILKDMINNGGYDPSDIYSAVHENVDGHQWIIYNAYNKEVIECSNNADAYKDCYDNEDIGRLVSEDGIEKFFTVQAFFAMAQDVMDALRDKKEELISQRDELEKCISQDEELIEDYAEKLSQDDDVQERLDRNKTKFDIIEIILENI
jgi:hypothetical protein